MNSVDSTEPSPQLSTRWNLYSRHGHILILLAKKNDIRLAELASEIGVSDRQIRSLLKPMQDAGVVTIERAGRNNRYLVNLDYGFTHPSENKISIRKWLDWHSSL